MEQKKGVEKMSEEEKNVAKLKSKREEEENEKREQVISSLGASFELKSERESGEDKKRILSVKQRERRR